MVAKTTNTDLAKRINDLLESIMDQWRRAIAQERGARDRRRQLESEMEKIICHHVLQQDAPPCELEDDERFLVGHTLVTVRATKHRPSIDFEVLDDVESLLDLADEAIAEASLSRTADEDS